MNDNCILLPEELRLKGYPICPGIALGAPHFFSTTEESVPEFAVPADQIDREVKRYYKALKHSRSDLITLQKRFAGTEAAAILGAHLEIMRDPLMTLKMEEAIREKGKNTEHVFSTVIGEYEKQFSRVNDDIFRERLKDVQDLKRRIISHLSKNKRRGLAKLTQKAIIFAHELSPSDTAEARADVIEAFVTRSGAETSHVAIMARAQGIPFVSNVDFPNFAQTPVQFVIVDGNSGEVILNPTEDTVALYKIMRNRIKVNTRSLKKKGELETVTLDGHKVRLSANVEMFHELDTLHRYGGEGVGLFRSEYLFLAKETFPSEEEQFHIYRALVEKGDGYPSVVRTFDLGGDKLGQLPFSRYERNPNLGCRAIRLMLKEKEIFKTQLRAILRASAFGDVRILFPMISGVDELKQAKELIAQAQDDLVQRGIPFSRHIPIGCMIEVPSAVITCDILAKECDFFSIGTNDLVQYSLAVDRGNTAMSYLYAPTHPSILRMIKMVVDEGMRTGHTVSICGEIAADPRFTRLLIGLGVQELSVAPLALPNIKKTIRAASLAESVALAQYALGLSTPQEVEEALP